MRKLIWAKLDDNGRMPQQANLGDAGWDLYVSEQVEIPPGEWRDLPHGLSIQMDSSLWCRICSRSSTIRKRNLLVIDSVIDSGYIGPLFTGVWNLNNEPTVVQAGERLSQLVPTLRPPVEFKETAGELYSVDQRGTKGFGSSDR